jgi:hypothetical protein
MSFREITENCPIEPDDRSPIVKLRCKFGANLFSGGELIRGLQGRKLRDLERAREKTRPIDTGCNPCVSGGAIFADFRIRWGKFTAASASIFTFRRTRCTGGPKALTTHSVTSLAEGLKCESKTRGKVPPPAPPTPRP